jgi:hypothetical protein
MLMVQALCFHSSNDLTVRNLRITNTPGAHIAINGCIGATFSHLLVKSPGNSPNTDGFDISHSKNIIATLQQVNKVFLYPMQFNRAFNVYYMQGPGFKPHTPYLFTFKIDFSAARLFNQLKNHMSYS